MKRFFTTLAIIALCGALMTPQIEARGNRGGGNRPPQGQMGNGGQRAGNPNPGHQGGQRPGNPGGQRPGNPGPGNHGGQRPGNPGPGNHGGQRPGNPNPGHQGGQRPGNPGPGYQGGHRPDFRPNAGFRPGPNVPPPPHRPMPVRPWQPPRPPHGWRPGPMVPTFSTILGVSFGTAINISINRLISSGYTVHSYGNNVVYLNSVNQLNLFWPDATLYYSNGGLTRGDFIYSTTYYDTMRYNEAYGRLVAAYGNPVRTSYPSNGLETTWFGRDGRFVTLTYEPVYGADGVLRYYTTLSFGF